MRRTFVAVMVLFLVVGSALVQGESAPPDKPPSLEDLSWLVGAWQGEGLGGEVEEYWTPARGGTMLGAFRLVVGGQLKVAEYLMITQEGERIVYRFKHFNADYTTWEEERPLEFTLISGSVNEAVFHSDIPEQHSPRRLTYRLLESGDLAILVEGSDEEGKLTEGFEIRMSSP